MIPTRQNDSLPFQRTRPSDNASRAYLKISRRFVALSAFVLLSFNHASPN
ncbi:hypothetical protein RBSH_01655 [Rhodopirellula baltica SH28]|uniref:Uncharacterized protein n=1 Tax=Rhodopirellula baltica SH28 TaxID=993517 RepID=K5D891_RHOBT|nr:hypothetical protein RBSH_01655 [Rhodopirellula baltica SH28]